jgi:tRNA A37 threonylcarbamoyladenosine biosynthesis protein TsaE
MSHIDTSVFEEAVQNYLSLAGESEFLNDAEVHFVEWGYSNVANPKYLANQIIIGRRGGKCHDALSIAYSIIEALYGDQE